jgi:hypothetical protein
MKKFDYKILIYLFIVIVLFASIKNVNADWLADGTCEVNTNCVISRQLVNDTTGSPISNAVCNITIFSPTNYSVITTDHGLMSNSSGNGFYIYPISYTATGYYPAIMNCDLALSSDVADVSFTISTREADKKLITFPILYILLISGYGLLIFGFVRREETIVTISSMLLVVAGIFILAQGIDSTINWTTNSFGIITLLIGGYFLIRIGVEQMENIEW